MFPGDLNVLNLASWFWGEEEVSFFYLLVQKTGADERNVALASCNVL